MKKIKLWSILTLLVCTVVVNAEDIYITEVVQQKLEAVDNRSKSVIFAGKSYRYELDVEKSSYTFVDDVKKAVPFSSLKVGEEYFFELLAKGDDIKRQNYKYVTFVSLTKPSE